MTRNELQAVFTKYLINPSIKENKEILEICCNFFRLAIVDYQKIPVVHDSDGYGKVIMQMVMSKTLHLNNLANGVPLLPSNGNPLSRIIDPTVLAVLVRNIFETAGVFNLIYRSTANRQERELVYELWHIAGLSYRQRFQGVTSTDENKIKAADEKKAIEKLIEKVKTSPLFMSMDEKNRGKIITRIQQKEYLIRLDSTTVTFLAWHDLIKIMGITEKLFSEMYTFFSLYTHPSFISVLQFGQMFDLEKNASNNLAITNLRFASYFICIFIADYVHVFPEVKKTFEKLALEEQILINGINGFIRGREFVVNDTLTELG